MDNRYGRHGPHAWRCWHKHRFNRCSSYFDKSAYDVIVYVQLPSVNIERIIFVMSTSELFPQESLNPFNKIGWLATNEAIQLAKADLEHHDPASDTDLEHIAGKLAYRRLQRTDILNMFRTPDSSEGHKVFITSFISKYHEIVEDGGMNVLDSEEEAIRLRAYVDQERDQNANHIPPSDLELTCRAAIQEHEQSNSDKRFHPDYFSEIAKRVNLYLSFYRQPGLEKRAEWKERLNRAGIFLE